MDTVTLMKEFRTILSYTGPTGSFIHSRDILIAELYDVLFKETLTTAVGVLICIFVILVITSSVIGGILVLLMVTMIDCCVFGWL